MAYRESSEATTGSRAQSATASVLAFVEQRAVAEPDAEAPEAETAASVQTAAEQSERSRDPIGLSSAPA
jgi:hypothetical protein